MKVEIGSSRFTQVNILDAAGSGNAHHKYSVTDTNLNELYATVNFQDGPIKESGVNGCHNEDLIAIVIHRLMSFQEGPYKCRENALAITKLEEAMHWLNHRTQIRQERGVEGTHVV
jgi:hypothetical protein